MMNGKRFREFVTDALRRFDKGDYGDISENDNEENIENRWVFGISRLYGRYGYCLTDRKKRPDERYAIIICIRTHEENTWITGEAEADWFLFLEDDQLKLIRNKCWTEEEDWAEDD